MHHFLALIHLHFPMAATSCTFLFLVLFSLCQHPTKAKVGVCNGMMGDNLPPAREVVDLFKTNGIEAMRLYDADHPTLDALKGSNIKVILGCLDDKLPQFASDLSAAKDWVETNVKPYASSIKYISLGNEIDPNGQNAHLANSVAPAINNFVTALNSANLGDHKIKVSTAIAMNLIQNSTPPSSATFKDMNHITPIINALKSNEAPLLLNVYPYTAYISEKQNIALDFALLKPGTVEKDLGSNLEYHNLFDAQVDSVYTALSKTNAQDITIVVSETGWPSRDGDSATIEYAGTYYKNIVSHVKEGTPLKKKPLETYLFAMFNENMKPDPPTERHYGLFTATKEAKYDQLRFN